MSGISKKPVPKWLVIGVIVVVVFAVGAVSRAFNVDGSSSVTPGSSTPGSAEAPAASFEAGDVTEARVMAELSDLDVAKVEVQDNLGTDASDDQIVHVSYRPAGTAGLGEKPMLMDLADASADAFEKLFSNPLVSAVDVTAVVVMSSGGADEQTAGARIYWDRKKADSVDFKKYRADVVDGYFWDAFTGAPDFYVHPGVLGGLSEADQAKLDR